MVTALCPGSLLAPHPVHHEVYVKASTEVYPREELLEGRTQPRGTLRVTKAPKTEREPQGSVPKERSGEMCQSDSARERLGRVAAS